MESIDGSLAGIPQPGHDALQRVFDDACLDGKPLIGVSTSAHHLSIFPFSPAASDVVRTELDGFSVSKGTIRFTAERPVPAAVIERLVGAPGRDHLAGSSVIINR